MVLPKEDVVDLADIWGMTYKPLQNDQIICTECNFDCQAQKQAAA